MDTITREYSYHDDGILPSQGAYGITYLTLYSSNAGNVYDGWIWDPDRRNSSEVERTFGYRNPNYPDYCWDDEVVVDLSNPQNREESEFEQGRITSFNTNVSDVPIILQDSGDISGLTEDQRERMATTVLFSAIPLVKDAYIHAEVEVCMKMNISPDNTTGRVRVEAFYILNDNSDRTMRPHPINHFSVSKPDEWNILRLLYWNPNLLHESQNYIGVKLLVTGGTAEIGISDDPEYGDAIITLTSAGLTGDIIDEKRDPVSLEIYGKELVQKGYKLDIDDYQVLCTYSDGQIFEVSRFCNFYPEMGTKIEANTVLVAEYLGLSTSMRIQIARVESIDLFGPEFFYGPFKLSSDYVTVFGYLENGEVADITDSCDYVPAMGSTISQTTNLTATATNYDETTASDTITMTRYDVIATDTNGRGLIYTLYEGNIIEITGNGEDPINDGERDWISIPTSITRLLPTETVQYVEGTPRYCDKLIWNAEGKICGGDHLGCAVKSFENFENVEIAPRFYKTQTHTEASTRNQIRMGITAYQYHASSSDFSFLGNIDFEDEFGNGTDVVFQQGTNDATSAFTYDMNLTNVDFLASWAGKVKPTSIRQMFYLCIKLNDLSGLTNWDVTEVTNAQSAFIATRDLKSAGALYKWRLPICQNAGSMFAESGLTHVQGIGSMGIGSMLEGSSITINLGSMFLNCTDLEDLLGIQNLVNYRKLSNYGPHVNIAAMFSGCSNLENIDPIANWDTENVIDMTDMFLNCSKLGDIYATYDWNMDNVTSIARMFANTHINGVINEIKKWTLTNCMSIVGALGYCGEYTIESGERVWYTPYIDNAAAIEWTSLVSRLTVNQVFGTPGSYGIIQYDTFTNREGNREYHTTKYGTFAEMDMHYLDGRITYDSQTEVVSGTVTFHFTYKLKIPEWYMQMIVDNYVNYIKNMYPNKTYNFSVLLA